MIRAVYLAVLCALCASVASAQYVINTSPGLFDPSYRGMANTTWFGWGPGSFDGATDNELIDNPAPTIGVTIPGIAFNQSNTDDILSGSDSIYSAFAPATDLLLAAPTVGSVGTGFTTIIVQGRTAFGGFGTLPAFSDVSGVSPTFVVGDNTSGQTQFWAKYELPGNESIYNLAITIAAASHTSIAELEVDTYWSAGGYAPDFAIVPEPSTFALIGLGSLAVVGLRIKSRRNR